MKLLLAGASGFIGKNFILSAPREWEITGTYFTSVDFLDFLELNAMDNVRPVRCDLRNKEDVTRAFGEATHEFDAGIFLVGNSDIGLSVKDPKLDMDSNLTGLINLLSAVKVRRFIFMSSGTVYLGNKGEVSPKALPAPDVPYGITKLASELYIKYFCNRKKTIGEYVILRFFGAWGPMEPRRKIYTNLIKELYFDKKSEYTLKGDGRNLIDAMYIKDAVAGLLSVVTAKRKCNITLDFCKGQPSTVNDLVKDVGRIFGKEVDIKHTDDSSEYIEFYASPEAMKREFGFSPAISLKEGMLEFLCYMKKTATISRSIL
jgi:UDP-glucose 4-epimerase